MTNKTNANKSSKLPRGNAALNTTGKPTTMGEAVALLLARGFRFTGAQVLTGSWDPKIGGSGLTAVVDPDGTILTITHGEFYEESRTADVAVDLYANGHALVSDLAAQAKFDRTEVCTVVGDTQEHAAAVVPPVVVEYATDEEIEAARKQYEDEGSVEIDDKAMASRGAKDGVYIQAWVWLPKEA